MMSVDKHDHRSSNEKDATNTENERRRTQNQHELAMAMVDDISLDDNELRDRQRVMRKAHIELSDKAVGRNAELENERIKWKGRAISMRKKYEQMLREKDAAEQRNRELEEFLRELDRALREKKQDIVIIKDDNQSLKAKIKLLEEWLNGQQPKA